jgi:hypothetical protein
MDMYYTIIVKALRMAHALRRQLTEATTRATLQAIPTRDQVRLLRACTTLQRVDPDPCEQTCHKLPRNVYE